MALNEINLNAINIEKLYGSLLLDEEKTEVKSGNNSQQTEALKSLGSNLKKTIILVNQPSATFLLDEKLDFLSTVLAACSCTIADVSILNCAGRDKDLFESLKSAFEIKNIILFDVKMSSVGLPLNIPFYQVQAYDNMKLLSAPDLLTIKNNKAEKNSLWISLKKLFEI